MAIEEQFLRVTEGDATGAEIPLDDGLVFGRSATGDGALGGDSELSREHAKLQRASGGEFLIEDLESTNGTFVNGKRITAPTPIRPGDVILIGTSTLELVGTVPAGAQPTAVAATPITPPEVQHTRVAETAPGPPGADAPAGPPPGVGGPPPGVGGPPPGVGGLKALPPPIAARIRRMAILAALFGFLLGFAIATLVWQVL